MKNLVTSKIKALMSPYAYFVLRKAGFYSLALFIGLNFAFFIPRLIPMNERFNIFMIYFFDLDKPIAEQYIIFWIRLIQLDLGPSFSYYPLTVWEVLFIPVLLSFLLVFPVLFLSFFIGNWIGGKAAYLKGRVNDIVYFTFIFISSTPFYWLALIIFVYFVTGSNILLSHPGGMSPEMFPPNTLNELFTQRGVEFLIDVLRHYLAPFFTLLIVNIGIWARDMRALTIYEVESNYLYYAKQLGFRPNILRKYAQRNAILPQMTQLNIRLNELIGATLIIEYVFLWPGLGTLFIQSISSSDYPLVMGLIILTLVILIGCNFLIDITYGFVDPRVKHK